LRVASCAAGSELAVDAVDCVIVGAGVIGLAIARELARTGREVLILERNDRHGQETSSRNSEVIHAGIYYPRESLKARLCVRGRRLLYDYCAAHGVPHRRCGKLIVATESQQQAELLGLQQAGSANGVDDLRLIDAAEALRLEPALRCSAALLSPSTGVIDVHAYMLALLGDAESHGAQLVVRSRVEKLRLAGERVEVSIAGDSQPSLLARWLINAAGLQAGEIVASIDEFPTEHRRRLHYAKGSYFSFGGRAPFRHLIYPLPEPGGLGVHLTLDLAGQARFGPDIEWVDKPDYQVDPSRIDGFIPRIRAFWPELPADKLAPAYAGVRPKLSARGEPSGDFRIDGPSVHGVPGLINLFGIESPGLTASLAIAETVKALVSEVED
jgi:L-2-hydroxyglutarate oxidase LhgO